MSATLSRLVGRPQKEVADFIAQMEDRYAYPSHDSRLVSEVLQSVKQKIASLGLDPDDTTGDELYHSLKAKFANDTQAVDQALGLDEQTEWGQKFSVAQQIVEKAIDGAQVWALKPTVARSILKSSSSKRLAKQLGYRSVDSMLKRENVGALYILAPYIESPTWQKNFSRLCAKLQSSDYNLAPVNFVQLPQDKLNSVIGPGDLNVCNRLTGSVAIWPDEKIAEATVTSLMLHLAASVEKLGIKAPLNNLLSIHPALAWWNNTTHLVADHEEPVSLNIHDVSAGTTKHGARALWSELKNRYESMGPNVAEVTEPEGDGLIPNQLAAQYQEVQ